MKKLGKFIKSNTKLFIGFILGAIIFGSIGAVVAGTVASSEITYTSNGQTTVQGALNDLYDKASKLDVYLESGVEFKYWNYNYAGGNYFEIGEVPASNYLYSSYKELVNLNQDTPFIRTTYQSGIPGNHSICLYTGTSTKKIFCFGHEYWQSIMHSYYYDRVNATSSYSDAVKDRLKADMETALNIPARCSFLTNSDRIECIIGEDPEISRCTAYFDGAIDCSDDNDSWSCAIDKNGKAECWD